MAQYTPINDAFGVLLERLTGFNHANFKFEAGVTPLTTFPVVFASLIGYLVIVFGLQALLKSRKQGISPTPLVAAHNLFLSGLSLVLLLLLAEIQIPRLLANGFTWAVCEPSNFINENRLHFVYYVNYLTKYYELIDTLFLVLKKKDLQFLHVYHHSLTMLLCYTQLIGHVTVQWVPILLNLGVHVLMYYYYFVMTIGSTVWWKRYVTQMQIVQFILDLIACYYAYGRAALSYLGYIDSSITCYGDLTYGFFGVALLTSYLFLFIDLYFKMYKGGKGGKDKKVAKKD